MNILRLNPSVLLDTPKGKALAIIFQDYGFDHHNLWTCVIEETGEIWTFQNPAVRARADYTFGVRQETSRSFAREISDPCKSWVAFGKCPDNQVCDGCAYRDYRGSKDAT